MTSSDGTTLQRGLLACAREEGNADSQFWYLSRAEIEDLSPSKRDAISFEEECYKRLSYSVFVQELGNRLRLRQSTVATATVYCHRYFLHRSHASTDRFVVATASLFLAAKVEEQPRILRDVLAKAAEMGCAGSELSSLVVAEERTLLTTLAFDLSLSHPYDLLGMAAREVVREEGGWESLAQLAGQLLNDSLGSSLWVQHRPPALAAAALFLAARLLQLHLPHDWWRSFSISLTDLQEMCGGMLDCYQLLRAGRGVKEEEEELESMLEEVEVERRGKKREKRGEGR